MSKGSGRRRTAITQQAEVLQWLLAYGKISFKKYQEKRKKLESENKWWKR